MEDDEQKKPPKNQYIIGADLEEHSVEALEELVNDLRTEIERIEKAITKKGAGLKAAESLFKK
ncbi:DUF1192 domain-containing protein [Martelella mediterranea]|uniref:Uncharacterized small protein (DUF1192 family) n=1 Tax=Martelella mediterranea TaxID=293089 RepID=A0A4V2V4T0_9HYPH|nr:DUF1192 domain-containing protein [Martelella mediterranea]TCT42844.1 uncharacterized small protein (DUF1192 family) [Martelella mediterranea]